MKLVIDIQMIDKNSAGALTYIKNMVHAIYIVIIYRNIAKILRQDNCLSI
jgi:hypothetical protein